MDGYWAKGDTESGCMGGDAKYELRYTIQRVSERFVFIRGHVTLHVISNAEEVNSVRRVHGLFGQWRVL